MQAVKAVSKLKVGVFFGGKSIEREVSLNSGRTICDHLDTDKYTIIPIFQDNDGALYILPWHFLHRGKISDFQWRLATEAKKISWDELKITVDFVYLAVHGRFAEDGTIQGMLEVMGIPYLGSKIFGSALGMNKAIQKDIFKANGIDVAKGTVIRKFEIESITTDEILNRLKHENVQLPCIIKPIQEGSSLGVTKIQKPEDLLSAVKKAAYIDPCRVQDVIIEEKIDGMEFVCVALHKIERHGNNTITEWFTLPITEVVPEGDTIFDYEQKYMPGRARKITPARCSNEHLEQISKVCIKASILLNFSTISRIDGFLTKDGRVVLVDPNTLTGMSPATFLFHQAAEFGMSHTQLINYLIETELKSAGMLEIEDSANRGDEKVSKDNNFNKIRVAVLLGGNTNEREISLESGRNICYKLSPQKYECLPLFVSDSMQLYKLSQSMLIKNSTREITELLEQSTKIDWETLPQICDFVFIALHGGLGEGGGVQGALEMLGLPYNGSGVLASSLCMDKFKTNNFLKSHGFDVPKSYLIKITDWQGKSTEQKTAIISSQLKDIDFPLILKPHDDGCSVFVKKATDTQNLINTLDEYFEKSNKNTAMIEEMIIGIELTCAVIGNDENIVALSPSMAVAKGGILSIEEKFLPGEGENQTPAPLPKDIIDFTKKTLESAYKTIGCTGYARIDCFYQDATKSPTGKDRIVMLEFNTLPGMTPATCIFHQAAEHDMKPMDFIDKIIELGFANHIEKIKQNNVFKLTKKTIVPSEKIEESSSESSHEKILHKKQKTSKTTNFESQNQNDELIEFKTQKDDFTMKLF